LGIPDGFYPSPPADPARRLFSVSEKHDETLAAAFKK
jgi:hypothetical protein